jgi:hypothetical protein
MAAANTLHEPRRREVVTDEKGRMPKALQKADPEIVMLMNSDRPDLAWSYKSKLPPCNRMTGLVARCAPAELAGCFVVIRWSDDDTEFNCGNVESVMYDYERDDGDFGVAKMLVRFGPVTVHVARYESDDPRAFDCTMTRVELKPTAEHRWFEVRAARDGAHGDMEARYLPRDGEVLEWKYIGRIPLH